MNRILALAVGAFFVASAASASVIDSFETGFSGWTNVGGSNPGSTSAAYAKDGSVGASTDQTWFYRNDYMPAVGDTLSLWTNTTGGGRTYLGFNATATDAYSFVAAPNTESIIFQRNQGYGYSNQVDAAQTYSANKFYRMEIEFLSGSTVGRLYDSDGYTLLSSITLGIGVTPGTGIAIRSFGGSGFDLLETNATYSAPNVVPLPAGGALLLSAMGLFAGASVRARRKAA